MVISVGKGDLNSDGKVDQKDLGILLNALTVGDMNWDHKLDQADNSMLKTSVVEHVIFFILVHAAMFIELGNINQDKAIDKKDLDLFGKILKDGDMDNDGKVDETDFQILRQQIHPAPIPLGNEDKAIS